MAKVSYKENGEWKDIEIGKFSHVVFVDNYNFSYELRAGRFGGIEIIANGGTISIEPHVSNHLTIKTNR